MRRALEVSAYSTQSSKFPAMTTLTDEMVIYTSQCYILVPTFLSDALPTKGANPWTCNSCPLSTYTLVETMEKSLLLQLCTFTFAIGVLIKSKTDG